MPTWQTKIIPVVIIPALLTSNEQFPSQDGRSRTRYYSVAILAFQDNGSFVRKL